MIFDGTAQFGTDVTLDKIRDLTPNIFATDFDFQITPARDELRGIVTPSCRDTKISFLSDSQEQQKLQLLAGTMIDS
jgi:hypothetical protein